MSSSSVWRPTSRFVCLAAGVVALLALGAGDTFAQVTGKVIGTITDGDTGQPLVGAQVVIEGTNLGNVTNEDGYYFINNVPVGVRQVTAQYLGYQTTSQEQRVLAGQTMTVDFALSSEVIEADEAIVAVIEREPLVARDNTISKTRFTAEETRNLPVDDVTEVITLGAGIYQGQGGFIVRGGRPTESATFIDGALITDFSTQAAGNNTSIVNGIELFNSTEASSVVGNYAVEEIDVVTGGFNAEFGHAQSGIINIVTREGGTAYHGNVRYTTDEVSPEQSYGFNSAQMSIGGPIIPDRLMLFGSFEATGADDFAPSVAGFNPRDGFVVTSDGQVVANSSGSTESLLPGNRGDRTLAQGKLTAFLPAEAKLTGTYLFSRDQQEFFDNLLLTEQFRGTANRAKTHDVIFGYDQQIFQTAERNLNLQVRGNYHLTRFFYGLAKTPELATVIEDRIDCGVECDIDGDTFDEDFLGYRIDDIEFFFEDSAPGSVFNLPQNFAEVPDPVFGTSTLFNVEGILSDFREDRQERRYGLRVDLDSQLNRVHRAKVGFEWQWINLFEESGNLTSSTFADKYDVDPRVGAAYVQDRLDYGDLVIDLGLRWDHWNPNQMFPTLVGIVPCDLARFPNQCTQGAEAFEAPTRNEFAPRVGVAHPITEATQVRLSYGKFYQLPQLLHFFNAFNTNFPGNPNINYGNPELDFVETTAFEAGITHLISENLVLDVVGYNRDRRGAVRQDVFQPGEIDPAVSERRIFVNGDNGNVKGFDITLSKRFSNYFSSDLAWSLQWARGTTSSPLAWAQNGFGRLTDPLNPPNLLTPPAQLQAEDFDRLHNINYQFQLQFPDDFREGSAVGQIFRNSGAFVIYNAQSGTPFTRREINSRGAPAEELGSSRLPWIHSGDIRLTKGFSLADGLDLSLFALVTNFLDVENVLRVHESTGEPDVSGFEDQEIGQLPGGDFFVEGAARQFPYSLEDIVETAEVDGETIRIRDRVANQDLDADGIVTRSEADRVYFEAQRVQQVIGGPNQNIYGDDPANYGAPRQFRFGAEIQF